MIHVDAEWLGQRLRAERKRRELTLEQVAKETGVSVATLSRIERGGGQNLKSDTLVTLAEWVGTKVEKLRSEPPPAKDGKRAMESTPDVVELHLRADKKLDKKTATALATLFRTVYDQLTRQMKKDEP